MRRTLVTALLASVIFFTTAAAKADLLFENPFPTSDWGIGPCSSCFGFGRVWDGFTLGADSKISQIESDLIFIGDVTTINYSIWDASLTTEVFSQSFTPGADMALVPAGWRFTASIVVPDLYLGPGDYYLSIYDPLATELMLWTLAPTLDGSGFQTLLEHPGSHTVWSGYDLAFRIIGSTTILAVPEPSTTLPFLLGIAGIGLLARRKRQRGQS